jgi:hypothetical protein
MPIEIIASYFEWLEKLIGIPFWAIVVFSIVCLFFVYWYGIRIPIAVLKTRKELTNLRQLIKVSIEDTKRNYHKQRPKYIWKT